MRIFKLACLIALLNPIGKSFAIEHAEEQYIHDFLSEYEHAEEQYIYDFLREYTNLNVIQQGAIIATVQQELNNYSAERVAILVRGAFNAGVAQGLFMCHTICNLYGTSPQRLLDVACAGIIYSATIGLEPYLQVAVASDVVKNILHTQNGHAEDKLEVINQIFVKFHNRGNGAIAAAIILEGFGRSHRVNIMPKNMKDQCIRNILMTVYEDDPQQMNALLKFLLQRPVSFLYNGVISTSFYHIFTLYPERIPEYITFLLENSTSSHYTESVMHVSFHFPHYQNQVLQMFIMSAIAANNAQAVNLRNLIPLVYDLTQRHPNVEFLRDLMGLIADNLGIAAQEGELTDHTIIYCRCLESSVSALAEISLEGEEATAGDLSKIAVRTLMPFGPEIISLVGAHLVKEVVLWDPLNQDEYIYAIIYGLIGEMITINHMDNLAAQRFITVVEQDITRLEIVGKEHVIRRAEANAVWMHGENDDIDIGDFI